MLGRRTGRAEAAVRKFICEQLDSERNSDQPFKPAAITSGFIGGIPNVVRPTGAWCRAHGVVYRLFLAIFLTWLEINLLN
jgi:hypothetical protein